MFFSPSRGPLLAFLNALLLSGFLASLLVGSAPIATARLLAALAGRGDHVAAIILFDLRLPRALLAIMVGAVLALAGAALQGYLRNPLAEPAVLGVSNAAALGAVVAIHSRLSETWPAALPLVAIAAALGALAILRLLAGRSDEPLVLVLAGAAVAVFASAGISLALNLAPSPFAANEIMTWLLGSLDNRTSRHVWIALPCSVAGCALLLTDGHALDALTLGEDGAHASGVDLRQVRRRLLLGVAIGVGGAVAVSGAVGFIGLVVPHLVRPWTDRSPSALLLPSALGGAVLLLLSDCVVRMVPTATELRLGVLTTTLGVPVFIVQLLRERRFR